MADPNIKEKVLALIEGCPVEDGMSLEEHDKHYHKGHYDPDTMTCNIRDDARKQDGEAPYYSRWDKGMTADELQSAVESNFDCKFHNAKSAEELLEKYGFKRVDAIELAERGKPLGKEVFDKHVRDMAAVLSDIRYRFPGFNLLGTKIISWNQTNQWNGSNWHASSSLDKRDIDRTTYIALGDFYSGEKALLPRYHIMRHEIGHSLATEDVLDAWQDFSNQFSIEDFLSYCGKYISEYAVNYDIEETIAEAFAKYTSPGYEKGMMPDEIEKLVEPMLHKPTSERITMDATDDIKIGERPGIEPLDGAYLVRWDDFKKDDKTAIRWDDNKHGMLTFDTHENRLRYVLKAYNVADDWIDALCKAYPGFKWSLGYIYRFAWFYRRTQEPLEKVLKKFEKWCR